MRFSSEKGSEAEDVSADNEKEVCLPEPLVCGFLSTFSWRVFPTDVWTRCLSAVSSCCCGRAWLGAHQEHRGAVHALLPRGDGQRHAVRAEAEPGAGHLCDVRVPPRGQARDSVHRRGHHLRVRGGDPHPTPLQPPQVQVEPPPPPRCFTSYSPPFGLLPFIGRTSYRPILVTIGSYFMQR